MIYRSFCIVLFLLIMHFGQGISHPADRTDIPGIGSPHSAEFLYPANWTHTGKWEISRYDALLRDVGGDYGYDWRLLSAIAYKESRFDPKAVSHRGAAGLMQIMPSVARSFDVDEQMIHDPRTNVTLAASLLSYIERSLRFSASATRDDRTKIMLASYNCGIGHVLDARRLAVKYGADPDSWKDVSTYLSLKSDSAYASDSVVTCGVFNGSGETLAFVKGVMGKYHSYCKRTES